MLSHETRDDNDVKKKVTDVCFAISSLNRGGAERQLFLLLKNLPRQSFRASVLSFEDGPWKPHIETLGIPVSVLSKKSRFARIVESVRLLRRLRPDVLHSYGASAGFIVRTAAICARIPVIIASERHGVESKSKFKFWVERLLGIFTTYVVCNAYHSAQFYLEKKVVPARKLKVIQNGLDPSEIAPWAPPSPPCVGYLANLRTEKNHHRLLQAFAIVHRALPSCRLILAGDGPLRAELEAALHAHAIAQNVELVGTVSDTAAFFSQISLYCHPSLVEGMPNALMEAMARGIPCVASQIPGNMELIRDGENGLLVNPSDPNEISKAIIMLLEHPEYASQLGEKGRAKISSDFSLARMVQETISLYPKSSEIVSQT